MTAAIEAGHHERIAIGIAVVGQHTVLSISAGSSADAGLAEFRLTQGGLVGQAPQPVQELCAYATGRWAIIPSSLVIRPVSGDLPHLS
jgi:hypothetical protein